MKEHSVKLTLYLLQNDVVLYFESYWKRENVVDINFWDLNKLNDSAPQDQKEQYFAADQVKDYGFKN